MGETGGGVIDEDEVVSSTFPKSSSTQSSPCWAASMEGWLNPKNQCGDVGFKGWLTAIGSGFNPSRLSSTFVVSSINVGTDKLPKIPSSQESMLDGIGPKSCVIGKME